jgi:hypothetical protein
MDRPLELPGIPISGLLRDGFPDGHIDLDVEHFPTEV